MAGNIEVAQMTATIPHPYPNGAAESWIATHAGQFNNGDGITWAMEHRASGKLVGCISFGARLLH